MRREYCRISLGRTHYVELPPRARRIHFPPIFPPEKRGTTSACAENTPGHDGVKVGVVNYLRVRGEYGLSGLLSTSLWELPPRARRIHHRPGGSLLNAGTTSACAENTYSEKHFILAMRNYLRVRGEYQLPTMGS